MMSEISGLGQAMNFASASLGVHSVGMQVAAHNVANVSTGNFEPQRATYATGSNGMSVELESVRKMPGNISIHGEVSDGMRSIWGGTLPSGTELAVEMPKMISTQHAFSANAATVRAVDEMLGTVLDLKA